MRIDENPCCILKTIVTSLVVQWLRTDCQCRGQGFDPWPGKVHAAEQPVCFNDLACAPQERLLQWETRAPQLEGSSRWLQLEKPSCSNKDPCTARKKWMLVTLYFFFVQSLQNLVCILYWQHIPVESCLISSILWSRVVSGCHTGWCFSLSLFLSL